MSLLVFLYLEVCLTTPLSPKGSRNGPKLLPIAPSSLSWRFLPGLTGCNVKWCRNEKRKKDIKLFPEIFLTDSVCVWKQKESGAAA